MPTTGDISKSIREASTRLSTIFRQNGWNTKNPISQTLGYNAPALSVDFIELWANAVADRVKGLSTAEMDHGDLGVLLTKCLPLFDQLNFSNVQQDPDGVIGGFSMLIAAIDARTPPPPAPAPPPPKVDWEDLRHEKTLLPKDLARRLRSVDARLAEIEPQAANLDRIIAEIVAARETADELPTDMADLRAKRAEINRLAEEASSHLEHALGSRVTAAAAVVEIENATKKAEALAVASERALRGSTGVGLAAAFEGRKVALSRAGVWWTLGLVAALLAGLVIGWDRVSSLKDVLQGDRPASVIWANVVLAIVGVGGPIWFAWLATKQIGSAFRLAEDYAFKATVSRAYEGYRKEAIELDEDLRTRLFSSALDRLEEAPIRLLDPKHHGSPLQEALDNPALRRALDGVPGLAQKLIALVPTKSGTAIVAPVAAAAGIAAGALGAAEEKSEPA